MIFNAALEIQGHETSKKIKTIGSDNQRLISLVSTTSEHNPNYNMHV